MDFVAEVHDTQHPIAISHTTRAGRLPRRRARRCSLPSASRSSGLLERVLERNRSGKRATWSGPRTATRTRRCFRWSRGSAMRFQTRSRSSSQSCRSSSHCTIAWRRAHGSRPTSPRRAESHSTRMGSSAITPSWTRRPGARRHASARRPSGEALAWVIAAERAGEDARVRVVM